MSLEITKLSKRFGNLWVLRDIDLTAFEGRILGVCGASGSGKTTLLNAIAGAFGLNGGQISLDGRDLTRLKQKDRDITIVADRAPKGILGIFGRSDQGSSDKLTIETLERTIERSGRILLLDDPFTSMDADLQEKCMSKVSFAASSADRVVIFATSDFQQIAALADDAAILSGGGISQVGTPRDIYEEPETVAAARLSGYVNLFEARRLTSTDATLPEFQAIAGAHRIVAQKTDKHRLGPINKNVTLAIRPEEISMSMGASFPEDNLVKAIVTGFRFCGATSLIEFDASGLPLTARVFKVVGLDVGDECMLGLPPQQITVLRN